MTDSDFTRAGTVSQGSRLLARLPKREWDARRSLAERGWAAQHPYLALGRKARGKLVPEVESRVRQPMPFELTAEERTEGEAWSTELDARIAGRLAEDDGGAFVRWKRAWNKRRGRPKGKR